MTDPLPWPGALVLSVNVLLLAMNLLMLRAVSGRVRHCAVLLRQAEVENAHMIEARDRIELEARWVEMTVAEVLR